MPLVINSLRDGHTHTYTCKHAYTSVQNFFETRHFGWLVPGLKMLLYSFNTVLKITEWS